MNTEPDLIKNLGELHRMEDLQDATLIQDGRVVSGQARLPCQQNQGALSPGGSVRPLGTFLPYDASELDRLDTIQDSKSSPTLICNSRELRLKDFARVRPGPCRR